MALSKRGCFPYKKKNCQVSNMSFTNKPLTEAHMKWPRLRNCYLNWKSKGSRITYIKQLKYSLDTKKDYFYTILKEKDIAENNNHGQSLWSNVKKFE